MKNISVDHHYKIAVILSSVSMVFGIFREILIVYLIGFTATNDILQLYLSIFYTIGLSIDAMRLSCLNLYAILSLRQILIAGSIITLPLAIGIGLIMNYFSDGLNFTLLFVIIISGYLNLLVALLVTYKQRNNSFLLAQIVNVIPNFIIIPGILFSYLFFKNNIITAIVCFTSITPVVQCILLLMIPHHSIAMESHKKINLWMSVKIFMRHLTAVIGDQLFQVMIRSAFYNYGAGYLSMFSMVVRLYSAGRYILVDSFIGARLANWQKKLQRSDLFIDKSIRSTWQGILIALIALMISLKTSATLLYVAMQLIAILMLGFYFTTLVRIIYFKINHFENNPLIVIYFSLSELITALIAFLIIQYSPYSILFLIWIGFIAKPFMQLFILKKHYHNLSLKMDAKNEELA